MNAPVYVFLTENDLQGGGGGWRVYIVLTTDWCLSTNVNSQHIVSMLTKKEKKYAKTFVNLVKFRFCYV